MSNSVSSKSVSLSPSCMLQCCCCCCCCCCCICVASTAAAARVGGGVPLPLETPGDSAEAEAYEDALRRLKEATGVSDVNEIIEHFLTQNQTYEQLINLAQGVTPAAAAAAAVAAAAAAVAVCCCLLLLLLLLIALPLRCSLRSDKGRNTTRWIGLRKAIAAETMSRSAPAAAAAAAIGVTPACDKKRAPGVSFWFCCFAAAAPGQTAAAARAEASLLPNGWNRSKP